MNRLFGASKKEEPAPAPPAEKKEEPEEPAKPTGVPLDEQQKKVVTLLHSSKTKCESCLRR